MLEMLVGRCRVGESNRRVLRYVISRLKDGCDTWRTQPKAKRRFIMREVFRIHYENRKLYLQVMKGI